MNHDVPGTLDRMVFSEFRHATSALIRQVGRPVSSCNYAATPAINVNLEKFIVMYVRDLE